MRVGELKGNPKNPRKITPAKLEQLKNALYEFGDLSGITFNRNLDQLVTGHQRCKNFDETAVVKITNSYEKPSRTGTVAMGYILHHGERYAYREVEWDEGKHKSGTVAANKNAGEWDIPQLTEWFQELDSFDVNLDLNLTMFDEEERKDLGLESVTVGEHTRTSPTGVDEDEIPEKPEARTKAGDLYALGDHRLLCGDSTRDADVSILMNGGRAELCFTSPPYADQRVYNDKTLTLDVDHIASFIPASVPFVDVFAVVLGLMRKDREVFPYWDNFTAAARSAGLLFLSWNVWNKMNNILMGSFNLMFNVNHEWIFVYGKESKILNKTVPNKYAGVFNDHIGVRQKDGSIFKAKAPVINDFRGLSTVIDCNPQKGNNDFDHPAMFSVELPQRYIEACVSASGGVYEPFCGSGSTLIACEKTGRRCFGMEIDPHYCDIIVERWEKYTGKKAELLNPKPKTILRKKKGTA